MRRNDERKSFHHSIQEPTNRSATGRNARKIRIPSRGLSTDSAVPPECERPSLLWYVNTLRRRVSWSVYQHRAHAHGHRVYRYICRPSSTRRSAVPPKSAPPMCICFIEHATMELWLRRQIRSEGRRSSRFLGSQPGDIQYCRYLYPTCVNISSARSSLMSNTLRSARFPSGKQGGNRAGWKYLNLEEIKYPDFGLAECVTLRHGNAMYMNLWKVYLSLIKKIAAGCNLGYYELTYVE